MTPRAVAGTVITRVLGDKAFAAAALDAELERAVQLDPRDRALATELVYGTLRLLPWLEARIARHAKRPSTDPAVRAHLAIAAYQIFVLSRVPAFAAVSEAVNLVQNARGKQVGGFANAVLRKLAGEPRPSADEIAERAYEASEPALRAAIVRSIGEAAARDLLAGDLGGESGSGPGMGLRIEEPAERDRWLERFREARPGARFDAGRVSPHAIVAHGTGKIVGLPGYAEGAWTPQEEGSQLVALALGAQPGDVVLDACAGRGNKTGLLARAVGSGAVDAADVHPQKLERLRFELERIGQAPRATFAVDWSRGTGGATGGYDRILVDAPCSGTGTLRRRPELALRRTALDIAELSRLQRGILERVAGLVKPGGRLVYAVCSVLREEAEDVVASAFASLPIGFEPVPFDAPSAAAIAGGAPTLRLLPSEHGTDGYFVASLRRMV